MSKLAAAVLACICWALFAIPMSAQILPRGNVYGGVGIGEATFAVNHQSYRGWEASGEALPFVRLPHIGVVVDGSGFYRSGIKQYNILAGLRLSASYGKWRPFVHAMGGLQHVTSSGLVYNPIAIDVGGGADYKLFFKNFSWRLQGDVMRTHYLSANQYDYRGTTGIVWRF